MQKLNGVVDRELKGGKLGKSRQDLGWHPLHKFTSSDTGGETVRRYNISEIALRLKIYLWNGDTNKNYNEDKRKAYLQAVGADGGSTQGEE
jgi:hypothetical protein